MRPYNVDVQTRKRVEIESSNQRQTTRNKRFPICSQYIFLMCLTENVLFKKIFCAFCIEQGFSTGGPWTPKGPW